jgi:O-antigen/teichoic acid export membrane protein
MSEPQTARGRAQPRVGRNLAWAFSGTWAQAVIQLAVTALLARVLSPESFGHMAVLLAALTVADLVLELGLSHALVQKATLGPYDVGTAMTTSVLIAGAMSGLVITGAPLIAGFFAAEGLERELQVLALVFPVAAVGSSCEALLQKRMDFRGLTLIESGSYVLGFLPVSVALALLGYGTWALVLATIARLTLRSALLLFSARRDLSLRVSLEAAKSLLLFGGGVTIAKAAGWVARNADTVIVGRALGVDAMGAYSQAYKLMNMSVTLFAKVIERVLFPAFSQVQDDLERTRALYRLSFAAVALTMGPASAALFVLAPEVVALVLGAGWGAAVAPVQILALGIAFRTTTKITSALLLASGQLRGVIQRQAVFAIVLVGAAFFGARWGLPGVAAAVSASLLLQQLLLGSLARSVLAVDGKELTRAVLPAVGLTTLGAACSYAGALIARGLGLQPWFVLPAVAFFTILVLASLSLAAPQRALGEDGTRFVDLLLAKAAPRVALAAWARERLLGPRPPT